MNLEEHKKEVYKEIAELQEDIEMLQKNISKAEEILAKVNSFEELEKYADFDMGDGLKHIELF